MPSVERTRPARTTSVEAQEADTQVDLAQDQLGNQAVQGQLPGGGDGDDGVLDDYLASLPPDQRDRELGTMTWLESKESTPDRLADFEAQAQKVVDGLDDATYDAYIEQGLSTEDLDAVAFYTSNAAYAMNAILRGQLSHPVWVDAFGTWSYRAAAALPKLPRGAKNQQGGELIDPTQAPNAHIDFDEVYRADDWSGHFTPMFLSDYRVGAVLEEPGFLSTTLVEGSYGADMAVQRVITNAASGKNISALSIFASENEALFPPGTRMRINQIVDYDTGRPLPDPASVYTPEEMELHNIDVEMEILEVGGGSASAGGERSAQQPVPDTDPLLLAAERASKV